MSESGYMFCLACITRGVPFVELTESELERNLGELKAKYRPLTERAWVEFKARQWPGVRVIG